MKQIVMIAGAPSRSSRLSGLLQHVEQELVRRECRVHWVQVSDLPAEDLIRARFDSPQVAEANALVEQADAVVVASPVYKAAYTGILKTYLDLLPQKVLERKTVLPMFIGGTIAHLLTIEYALKPVLSVLGARHQLSGVFAVDTQVLKTPDGQFVIQDDELLFRLNKAVEELAG